MADKKINNMITPSVDSLSQDNKYNRYTLAIAIAKCAKEATKEYQKQRSKAERMIENKETNSSIYQLLDKEYRDERAVRIGIDRLSSGQYVIDDSSLSDENCDKIKD